MDTRGGIRTHDLLLRRETRYPLRHTGPSVKHATLPTLYQKDGKASISYGSLVVCDTALSQPSNIIV
jgi:hypothetical protein